MRLLINLDKQWRKISHKDKILDEEDITYHKYGKNYFGSYIIAKKLQIIDEEDFNNEFINFKREFKNIKSQETIKNSKQIGLEDFKSDSLFCKFKERLKNKKENENQEKFEKINREDLCRYLNESNADEHNIKGKISEYLYKNNIELNNIKIIFTEDRNVKYPYEFKRITFDEFYEVGYDKIKYKDSKLKEEVNNKNNIFIVNIPRGGKMVSDVEFFDDFSFEEINSEAEDVFNLTKTAFIDGDESKFITSIDDKKIYVRAIQGNEDLSFEFSNGKNMKLRTFVVSVDTVQEIVNKMLNKKLKISDNC
ncbi:MAG: hypothetical protein ACLTAJ_08690 [Clostridium sp.]|uniref:hypothetical protein n=1 Tax=Clostridium sp. TaxID=1506 RepID=UPI003991883C